MKRAAAVVACALACATWPAAAAPAVPAAAAAASASAPAAAIDPDRAREQARDVLAERRFQPNELPSPLRRVRERIGDALRRGGGPLESAFNWVAGWFPGGPPLLITLLAGTILAGTAVLVTRSAARRRQAGAGGARALGADAARQPGAAQLRRQADDAERRGDLDAALRLRFRAGLVELHTRELIELRPALTNHELLRAVPSATLADLVDGFEAVAYGGREAAAEDVARARDGWPLVVEEAGPR